MNMYCAVQFPVVARVYVRLFGQSKDDINAYVPMRSRDQFNLFHLEVVMTQAGFTLKSSPLQSVSFKCHIKVILTCIGFLLNVKLKSS